MKKLNLRFSGLNEKIKSPVFRFKSKNEISGFPVCDLTIIGILSLIFSDSEAPLSVILIGYRLLDCRFRIIIGHFSLSMPTSQSISETWSLKL